MVIFDFIYEKDSIGNNVGIFGCFKYSFKNFVG